MNVYDTANKLAQEIKSSEEYLNFKKIKENINIEYKESLDEEFYKIFQGVLYATKARYELDVQGAS